MAGSKSGVHVGDPPIVPILRVTGGGAPHGAVPGAVVDRVVTIPASLRH